QIIQDITFLREDSKGKKDLIAKKVQPISLKEEELDDETTTVPFTARLMAYQRAQESKRDSPLLIDPFAERLAGDLTKYLKKHVRYSEMEYPLVRCYHIEEQLLTPWCKKYVKSQIVLLGAGLDTRAYRFKPFQSNTHILFEVDFPNVIHYKESILEDKQPLCRLVRISVDLSDPDWTSYLMNSGFSSDIPTFWVLEGLVYYMEQRVVASLLANTAEISVENSEIFVDLFHASRWVSFPTIINGLVTGFAKHFKWGLDIKLAPSFFATTGWKVSCAFADEYDQGRNVGQKAMIFVHGIRAT
ncbi:MAG: class I SAM-dependent methyltransferase, partial [Promethearchaeota archaeon]